jgi:hypothetical protein
MTEEGKKFDDGKTPLDLLPPGPLWSIAQVREFGAKQYGAYNWLLGMKYSRVYAAALRHMFRWWSGCDRDKETGQSHLAHAAGCLIFLLEYSERAPLREDFKKLDDRPDYEPLEHAD